MTPEVPAVDLLPPPAAPRAGVCWIWPLRIPARVARRLDAAAVALAGRVDRGGGWVLAGMLAGTLPLLLGYFAGLPGQQAATALLLAPLVVAAAAVDSPRRGLWLLGASFAAHNALAIWLAARDPAGFALVAPGGADYWEQSRHWIVTGENPEYDLRSWVPAHLQLAAGAVLYMYTSLGFLTLWQGVFEVDLMNFYVGRLTAHSDAPALALLLGWHPWSLLRGCGYLVLTFEVVSWSLSRLTGRPLSAFHARVGRWSLGLGFLAADAAVKYACLDLVRHVLAAHLKG